MHRRWICSTTRPDRLRSSFQIQIVTRATPRCARRCQQYSVLTQKVEHTRATRLNESILIQKSQHLIEPGPSATTSKPRPDPYVLYASELSRVQGNLLGLLGSAHPGLSAIAKYYFLDPSKQLRSLVVILFGQATNGLGREWQRKDWEAKCEAEEGRTAELDFPLLSSEVLDNPHPNMPNNTPSFANVFELRKPRQYQPPSQPPPSSRHDIIPNLASTLLPAQLRLAQIVEMVHIASQLHEEVYDPRTPTLDTAEGESSPGFGNKLSILGGDFLLGRASTALSRLGESEVVELIAGIISNLVEGEMLRIRGAGATLEQGPKTLDEAWDLYLRKSYLKTASLLAKSARAATILGGCTAKDIWTDVAYAFGRNLGFSCQLVQDALDYEAGKGAITAGTVTAPMLFAAEEHPELLPLIARNLSHENDIEQAVSYVSRSSGVERTRQLAQSYTRKARDVIAILPDSNAKSALDVLTRTSISRTW